MGLEDALPKGPTFGSTVQAGVEARKTQEEQIAQQAEVTEQQRANTALTALTSMFIKDKFQQEMEGREWTRKKEGFKIKNQYEIEAEKRLEDTNKRESLRKMYLAYHDSLAELGKESTVSDEGLIQMWMKGVSNNWGAAGGGGSTKSPTGLWWAPDNLSKQEMEFVKQMSEKQTLNTYDPASQNLRKNIFYENEQSEFWKGQQAAILNDPMLNGASAQKVKSSGSFQGIPPAHRSKIIGLLGKLQEAQKRIRASVIRHRVLSMQAIQNMLGEDMLPIQDQYMALAGLREQEAIARNEKNVAEYNKNNEEEGEEKPAHRGQGGNAPVTKRKKRRKPKVKTTVWQRDQALLNSAGLGEFWEQLSKRPQVFDEEVSRGDQPEEASVVPSHAAVADLGSRRLLSSRRFRQALGYAQQNHIPGFKRVVDGQEHVPEAKQKARAARLKEVISANKARAQLLNTIVEVQKGDILERLLAAKGGVGALADISKVMANPESYNAKSIVGITMANILSDPKIKPGEILADEKHKEKADKIRVGLTRGDNAPSNLTVLSVMLLQEMTTIGFSNEVNNIISDQYKLPSKVTGVKFAGDNSDLDPTNNQHVARELEAIALTALSDSPEGQKALYAVFTGRQPHPSGAVVYSMHGDAIKSSGRVLNRAVSALLDSPGLDDAYTRLLKLAEKGEVTKEQWEGFKRRARLIMDSAIGSGIKPLDDLIRAGNTR